MGCASSKDASSPTNTAADAALARNGSASMNPLGGAFALLDDANCFHPDPELECAVAQSPSPSPPSVDHPRADEAAARPRRHRSVTPVGERAGIPAVGFAAMEPTPEEHAARLKRLTDIAREVHGYTAAVDQYPAPPADSARVRYSQHVCAQWLSSGAPSPRGFDE